MLNVYSAAWQVEHIGLTLAQAVSISNRIRRDAVKDAPVPWDCI